MMNIGRGLALGLAIGLVTVVSTAQADEAGEKVFKKCSICHAVKDDGKKRMGPLLGGVVGRKSGTVAGFKYSDGMAKAGLTWDEATLDAFLTDPKGKVPGTLMSFPGLKEAGDRAAVIGYLKAN